MGWDDFARRVLGPADRIEMPLMGKAVTQHQPAVRVFRKDAEAAFAAPVSGVVTEINSRLLEAGGGAHGRSLCHRMGDAAPFGDLAAGSSRVDARR